MEDGCRKIDCPTCKSTGWINCPCDTVCVVHDLENGREHVVQCSKCGKVFEGIISGWLGNGYGTRREWVERNGKWQELTARFLP